MAKSSGRGNSGGTILLAVAATVVVVLFLAWISRVAEPSVPPEIGASDPDDAVTALSAAEFEPGIAAYIGRDIELTGVPVVEHSGATLVWVELPSGSPYLIKVSDAVAANGLPDPGTTVTVVGTVRQKTDAVLDGWLSAGVLADNQRDQVAYGDTYIDATAIRAGG